MPVSKKAIELFEETSGITLEEAHRMFDNYYKGEEMKPVIVTNCYLEELNKQKERILNGGKINPTTDRFFKLLDKYDLACVMSQNMTTSEMCDFIEAEFGEKDGKG